MRIDKFFSSQNIAARKDIPKLIKSGLIEVNGKKAKSKDEKIDPENDEIKFDGQIVSFSKHIYIMMNKPKGVLSSTRDKNAKTVLDLLSPEHRRKGVFPAGRLDKDTTGLLIITDDGDLAHKMLSPKSTVYKYYEAIVDLPLDEKDVEIFNSGIKSGDDVFLPALLILNKDEPTKAVVKICEGKFHQVKRMFHACGKEVLELKRLQIGNLALDEKLDEGVYKLLTIESLEPIFEKIDKN